MFKELFLAAIISASVSVRTPNDDTKPLDYEFSIKGEKNKGNLTYTLKRDWERELGEEYINDTFSFNHKFKFLYYGIDYLNKESKDIFYRTYNAGAQHPIGLNIGISIKEDIPLLSAGFNKNLKKNDFEFNIKLTAKSNFEEDNILNVKSEIKKWIGQFNIFGLYKHEYYNKKEDFQFKVGIGVKL